MRVIRNRPDKVRAATGSGRSVVTIGNFDAIHRGHQALIERCRALAAGRERVAVVTFEPLPQAFFRPDAAPPRLTTVFQKLGLLRSLGVHTTWMMRFDQQLAAMQAQAFVEQVLVRSLGAVQVVVGEDFRFGRGREGDLGLLRKLGQAHGFGVSPVAAVMNNGERISSSGIRRKLASGDFETAAAWLGRPFRMEGHVLRGAGLGRKLGYPTANLAIRSRPSPLQGVLAAYARVSGGAWLPAVINLGRRPAVGGTEPLLEVHFFDFDQDLYGQRLEVQFVAKLRDELDFATLDDLVAQMKHDESAARSCLAETPLPE
jgi:riboflavin kinase/FMN adenylyltransferase